MTNIDKLYHLAMAMDVIYMKWVHGEHTFINDTTIHCFCRIIIMNELSSTLNTFIHSEKHINTFGKYYTLYQKHQR